ncbi:MAG TPA: hypothetical protein VK446_11980 [Methylocystis sp.]|nr:hypothetical protein [Methylocystis sp.]
MNLGGVLALGATILRAGAVTLAGTLPPDRASCLMAHTRIIAAR